MRTSTPLTVLGLGVVLAFAAGSTLSAQSTPTPACALLSTSDIKKATGIESYGNGSNGDAEGEGLGGGSSCQWGGASFMGPEAPLLSLVLIRGKGYTERARTFKLAAGCKREPVSGVGDLAFFEACPTDRKRSAPLYVRAGANDLVLQMDVAPPATAASVRATLVTVAKAAVARLR